MEYPVSFECHGDQLVGIWHDAGPSAVASVVMVVGGPQYRVGSHRMYVEIARELCARGFSVLRFDCRGMGDSEGNPTAFDSVDADIDAAVAFARSRGPKGGVALFGLCDGASASLMYCSHCTSVAGICVANPWVRTVAGEAKVRIKTYYFRRMLSRETWRRFMRGEIALGQTLKSIVVAVASAMKGKSGPGFVERMRLGIEHTRGRVLVLFSDNDLVADEFRHLVAGDRKWSRLLSDGSFRADSLSDVDHTFSRRDGSEEVGRRVAEFLGEIFSKRCLLP